MSSLRGETRVGDIFVSSVTVRDMVIGSDKGVSNGIQQVIGYSGVVEDAIDEKDKAVTFIVRIGVDVIIRIMPATGITVETSPSLAVFNKDDLASKTIRMVKDSLDEASNEVTVRATPVLPLSVDFDQDHVIGFDQSCRPTEIGLLGRAVEFQTVFAQKLEKGINSVMVISVPSTVKGLTGNIFDPEEGVGRVGPSGVGATRKM